MKSLRVASKQKLVDKLNKTNETAFKSKEKKSAGFIKFDFEKTADANREPIVIPA